MLSPTAGADIATAAAAVITAVAVYVPFAGTIRKRQATKTTAREYPRFLPVPERTGRFTREPVTAEQEREHTLAR